MRRTRGAIVQAREALGQELGSTRHRITRVYDAIPFVAWTLSPDRSRRAAPRTFIRCALVLLVVASATECAAGGPAAPGGESSPAAAVQEPRTRTKAEAKLDSRLLDALDRRAAGDAPASDRDPLDVDVDDRVLVDITATVTPQLLQAIETLEGIVISQFPRYEAIRARVPFDELVTLAERVDITLIRPAEQAITNPSSTDPR